MTQSYTLWADGSTGGKRSRRHKGGKRSRRHKGGKRSRRHKGGKRSRRHKGGKRSRLTKGGKRSRRKHRGGGLGTSLLPFGLWGLQKLFQKKSTRKEVKHISKSIRRKAKRIASEL